MTNPERAVKISLTTVPPAADSKKSPWEGSVVKRKAFRAAVPYTLPICVGFLFMSMSYGFLMHSKGFSFVYPMVMSALIFAGSMEFVTVDLLLSPFAPVRAFLMALMVNARHLFYGISMLDRYKNIGWKKPYLIFGMCDESFTINCTVDPPEGVDRGWFMFFVNLLDQLYWVAGATLGGLLGYVIRFDTTIAALHKWKHNTLLSIGGGTVLYMVLVQRVFV